MKTYTTVVEIDADTQEYIITFPEEIIQELNWKEGDTLNWEVTDSKQVIVTKIKDSNSIKEEPTMSDYDWYTVKEEAIKEYLESESEGKDFDTYYDNYIQATNEDTYGDQGSKQQKTGTVPPPEHFPHFP